MRIAAGTHFKVNSNARFDLGSFRSGNGVEEKPEGLCRAMVFKSSDPNIRS